MAKNTVDEQWIPLAHLFFEHTHPLAAADATILGEFHQKTSEPSNSPAGAQKINVLALKENTMGFEYNKILNAKIEFYAFFMLQKQ